MSDTNFDPMAAAKQIMKDRENAIKTLAKVASDIEANEAKLSELHDEERTAYDSALAVGWSQAELKQIGFSRRSSGKKTARKRTREEPTGETLETVSVSEPTSEDKQFSA